MVDINKTGKIARDLLWGFRKRFDSKKEGQRIIAKHVRSTKKSTKASKPKPLKKLI
jgi:deoxyribodipyrimidine photo-lyase